MPIKEFLPRRPATSFGCWFDTVSLQDICDCCAGHDVAQIGQSTLNPPVTPSAIFFRHPDHQRGNFGRCRSSSRRAQGATIVLRRDQFPMSGQQRFWCHDCRDLSQHFAAELFCSGCKAATLIVGKSHAALPNLLAKNTILLDEIFNYLLFPPVNPTSNANNKKGKWIQTRSHPGSLSRAKRRVSRMQ